MRIKLLGRAHNPLVLGMSLAHLDFDHDGFLHLGRNHIANFFVAPRSRRRLCLLCCSRHLPAPFFALALVLVFALVLFFALAVVLFFSVVFVIAGAVSCAAPRMLSSRSRATLLICSISLRSWRSLFTP